MFTFVSDDGRSVDTGAAAAVLVVRVLREALAEGAAPSSEMLAGRDVTASEPVHDSVSDGRVALVQPLLVQ